MGKERIALQNRQRIPVSPEIVRKLKGNVAAAFYYQQLLYYDQYENKDSDGWFHKNTREIEDDICIGRRQQEHSRQLLASIGWIEIQAVRGGTKPTMLFRVLVDYHNP